MQLVSLELQGALVSKSHLSNSSTRMRIWIELILTSTLPNSSNVELSTVYYKKVNFDLKKHKYFCFIKIGQ